MPAFTVTLKSLRKHVLPVRQYNELVRAIQGKPFSDEDASREAYIRFAHKNPIPLAFVLENIGLGEALWVLPACKQTKELDRACRLFAVWCARQVQHLMKDPRSLAALDVAERHANGEASDAELDAARTAALAAARAADKAARDAACAAWAADAAARERPNTAAWAAAWIIGWSAAQKAKFIEVFCGEASE